MAELNAKLDDYHISYGPPALSMTLYFKNRELAMKFKLSNFCFKN